MPAILCAWGLGLLVGSFLNVCIHRWPTGESVASPRSRCPRCATPIRWFDNIPLASFAVLRGRCRDCRKRIPWRYPLVEFVNAAAYALIVGQFGIGPESAKLAILASLLLVLFCTDLSHLVLPDRVTLTGLGTGVALSWFIPLRSGLGDAAYLLAGIAVPEQVASVTESVLSAALFGGMLLLVREGYFRLMGIDGLGKGDVKLVAMIGAFQGSSETLLVILGASLLASTCGLAAVLAGRMGWRDHLPFGSYIAGVALASIFFADDILNIYWELMLR